MSEVLEYAARLSRVVGPRPAGTEEEQQASFFIEEIMSEAGLETSVEEFNCNLNYEMPRIICCVVTVACAILSICLPLMVVPALILCAISAVFYTLEVTGYTPLANIGKGGVSQNVIAKYRPGMSASPAIPGSDMESGLEKIDGKSVSGHHRQGGSHDDSHSQRKRKIVILARYDSGRIFSELRAPILGVIDKIQWAEIAGMAIIPIALLLRIVTGTIDANHIAWDIITGLGALIALIPVIIYIMHQTSPYSEGANNNASGVAVMMEAAKRIIASSKPSLPSKAETNADGLSFTFPEREEEPTVISALPEIRPESPLPMLHGREAIENAGVLPEDTDLIYDEAANGQLEREDRRKAIRRAVEDEFGLDDSTTAFTPVPHEPQGPDAGEPARLNGLSLQAQLQNTSEEYAKFDGFGDKPEQPDDNNPWARLKQEAKQRERASNPADREGGNDEEPKEESSSFAFSGSAKPVQDENVPDWFKKGMAAASANKPDDSADKPDIKRSRFADALDAAHDASAQAIENFEGHASPDEESLLDDEAKKRLDQIRAQIMNSSQTADDFDDSDEAKAERKAKLIAARDARNAAEAEERSAKAEIAAAEKSTGKGSEKTLAEQAISKERAEAELLEAQAEVDAALESQENASADQLKTAHEVAEHAAVADRTISFIPVAADIPAEEIIKNAQDTSSIDPIKKTAEEILDDAASITSSHEPIRPDGVPAKMGRRNISLPSLSPAKGEAVQSAPLADDANRQEGQARTALKNVGGNPEYGSRVQTSHGDNAREGVSQSLEGATTNFLQQNATAAQDALSSLDGTVAAKKQASRSANAIPANNVSTGAQPQDLHIEVNSAGAFVAPSLTSNFKPVGNELVENMSRSDIVVEDADDSDYAENVTHTGAMAGPGYVEMPKSRMSRLKSIFGRRKKDEDEMSFSDAVGIEEGFDAREVGKARGDWSSFKNAAPAGGVSNGMPNGQAGGESANREQLSQQRPMQQPMRQPMQQPMQQPMRQPMQQPMQRPMQRQPMGQPNRDSGPVGNVQGHPAQSPGYQQGRPQGPKQMNPQQPPQQQMPRQRMPMQGQAQQMPGMGRPQMQFQGQMQMNQQMQGQNGQVGMQYQSQQQFQMQAQRQPVSGDIPQNQARGINQEAQWSMQSSVDAEIPDASEDQNPQGGSPKKNRSFSLFKKRGGEGDMNSGAFDDDNWAGGDFGDDVWNGGAFSTKRAARSSKGQARGHARDASHGSSAGRRRSADEVLAEEFQDAAVDDNLGAEDIIEEREQIRNFRTSSTQLTSFEEVAKYANSFSKRAAMEAGLDDMDDFQDEPDIGFQTEVWFVALGAELANNAGVKNFLADHADELRGAMIVDIEGLGAGQLSIIEEEGVLKHVKSSTRMKRFATKAAGALGMKLGAGKMLWRESAAYFTTKRGLLTMHLCGMADGKPAYFGEAADTFDKLDEETMIQNTAFLLEMVNVI